MNRIGIDYEAYATELNIAKSSANSMHIGNGLNHPSSKINTKPPKEIWKEYDKLTKLFNAYAEIVIHDLARFKQVGDNKVIIDKSNR